MARSKNNARKRAAKQHRKAVERERKARSESPGPRSVATDLAPWAALAELIGELPPIDDPPDWACSTHYTPAEARMVVAGRPIPGGLSRPPPHHVAKLEAWLGIASPWGLAEVRERTTPELLAALAGVGVSIDAAGFRQLAAGHPSAWRFGQSLSDAHVDPEHLLGASDMRRDPPTRCRCQDCEELADMETC